MKIALITHSYHRHTRSNSFFIDLLKKLGPVEIFYDSTWRGERESWIDSFEATSFDCIVIWQVHYPFEYVRHPNVVFVPMYDDIFSHGKLHWSDKYNAAKIICFSEELHRLVPAPDKRFFAYYPDPRHFPICDPAGLRGFFWKRVRSIDEHVIGRLAAGAVFDQFTLHDAPDPGSGAILIDHPPIRSNNLRRFDWQPDRAAYLGELAAHNIFFASRPVEGIGMSFLEAMAMGLCVAAPRLPTHNQYITNGKTGLLYDLADLQPLDFSTVSDLGARARQSVEEGFRKWSEAEDELLWFIASKPAGRSGMAR